MKIGFIGLGIMGSQMAANLQKQGHDLVIYNRTKEKARRLLQNGATWAKTPASVGSKVEILFTMLSEPEAVRETALGETGFLTTMKAGSLWVDCSTVNPKFSHQMAAEAAKKQLCFIDAPVTGSRVPAEKGQLTFLVGGSNEDVQKVIPLLNAMGQKIIHAGGTGMGVSLKLVFNLLLAETMLAFSEGLVLGESLGLKRELIFDTLQGSIVIGAAAINKRPMIESGNYPPDFPLQWMRKDLEMISLAAYENQSALPSAALAKEIYTLAIRSGYGHEDFSAIYQFLSEKKDRG